MNDKNLQTNGTFQQDDSQLIEVQGVIHLRTCNEDEILFVPNTSETNQVTEQI